MTKVIPVIRQNYLAEMTAAANQYFWVSCHFFTSLNAYEILAVRLYCAHISVILIFINNLNLASPAKLLQGNTQTTTL